MSNKDLLSKISSYIKDQNSIAESYKKFYAANGPLTENIVDGGIITDLNSGITEPYKAKVRETITLAPKASVLIKKKPFSTLDFVNEIRWMNNSEIFLLRATKALFAYKVQQIRAYECLTKAIEFDKYNDSIINISNIVSLIDKYSKLDNIRKTITENSSFTFPQNSRVYDGIPFSGIINDSIAGLEASFSSALKGIDSALNVDYEGFSDDISKLLKKSLYSIENNLTTFIVDFNSIDNYGTGPGTGVIELANFNSFNVNSTNKPSPSGLSLSMQDPMGISTIREEDIDIAIEESLNGNMGIFKNLLESNLVSASERNIISSYDSNYTLNVGTELTYEIAGNQLLSESISNLKNLYSNENLKNVDIGYVYDRLRVFYLGKGIVNPPDGVHVFIKSDRYKQRHSGNGGQSAKFPELFDDDNKISDLVLEAEREMFTNKKIPFETYKQIRKTQEDSFGMIHVFGGFVSDTSNSYQNGSYTFNFSAKDNMAWLEWSRYNESPSLSDPQGILEDPLTPFEFKKNSSGGVDFSQGIQLSQENKDILGSGLLSYDSGILSGNNASELNLFQNQYNGFGSLNGTEIMQHPSGFVYRWKTGILTATAGFQTADENGINNQSVYNKFYNLPIAKNVISNLDVANIISVLVTGKPYNMEMFIRNAQEAMNIVSQRESGSRNDKRDPIASVVDVLKKQNKFYGNFKPYRTISVNSKTIQKMMTESVEKQTASKNIRTLQARRAEILDRITKLTSSSTGPLTNQIVARLNLEAETIRESILDQINIINDPLNGYLSDSDRYTFDVNFSGTNIFNSLQIGSKEDDDGLKIAKSLIGSRRRIEDVRLNVDRNYLVVSDEYDANTEIRPYLLEMRNSRYPLFQSSYASIFSQCTQAASYLNLEFFCNSQGHLEFRPPQWNKIPLSVLKDLIRTKKLSKKNVIPDYILDLYATKKQRLENEIKIINIEIVILALLLGKFPDQSLIPGLSKATGTSILSEYTSSENSMLFFGVNIISFNSGVSVSPEISNTTDLIGFFEPEFSLVTKRSGLIDEILYVSNGNLNPPAIKFANPHNIATLRNSCFSKFAKDPVSYFGKNLNELFEESEFIFNKKEGYLKTLSELFNSDGILTRLKNAISKRDRFVTILKNNQEKINNFDQIQNIFTGTMDKQRINEENDAGIKLDKDLLKIEESLSNTINFLDYNNDRSGSVFDNLIENDEVNLLGYGSGKRFVINDSEIINASYSERPPEFSRVNVTGSAALGQAAGLNSATENFYFWAGGTDFDLWRQYGYTTKPFNVPFFSSDEFQCKPFAYFQLQLQRSKVLQGSITVIGNEFYQPGDVIYIKSKGLLYYVEGVTHNFSIGNSYTTSLQLSYGHPPGVYMPSPLDIFGQQLTTNFLKDGILVNRSNKGDDAYTELYPDCSFYMPNGTMTKQGVLSHNNNQLKFFNMMSSISSGQAVGTDKYLLIRAFINDETNSPDSELKAREYLNVVKSLFTNPEVLTRKGDANFESDPQEPYDWGNFFPDAASFAFEKNIPHFSSLSPLQFPGGGYAPAIPDRNIILQICNLKKPKDSKILCLNPKLAGKVFSESSETSDNLKDVLPKGGMKQDSWLSVKNIFNGVFGTVMPVVEVGILNTSGTRKI